MDDFSFSLLREPNIEAATDIARLLPQLSSTPREFTLGQLSSMLSQQRAYVYVVERDGVIVGMLTIVGYLIPTGEKWQLEDVVLDERLRGRGIAKRFIEWAIVDFRSTHPNGKVYLTSRPSRVAANALYQSLGFTKKETNNYVF